MEPIAVRTMDNHMEEIVTFTSQGARADSPEERFSPTWPKPVGVLIPRLSFWHIGTSRPKGGQAACPECPHGRSEQRSYHTELSGFLLLVRSCVFFRTQVNNYNPNGDIPLQTRLTWPPHPLLEPCYCKGLRQGSHDELVDTEYPWPQAWRLIEILA